MRLVLAVWVALLSFAAPAQALRLMVNGDTPSVVYQRWADDMSTRVQMPDIEVDLRLLRGRAETVLECGVPADGCVTYSRPSPRLGIRIDRGADRVTFEHEMGHLIDVYLMTDARRDWFRRLLRDPHPWRYDGGNSPHERFAEGVSLCAMNSRRLQRRLLDENRPPWKFYITTNYLVELSRPQLSRFCSMLR